MKQRMKVAVVGAGMMGLQHIEALRRIPGIDICAIADTDRQMTEKACEKFWLPAGYDNYREMFEKERPDAVHVCTPNFAHYEVCRSAIEHGIHVFCEKPLTNTLSESREIVELAKEKGLICGINYNYRQNVMVCEMHERIKSGNWGRTFCVRGEYLQDWMMYDSDYNWRCIAELGGESRTVADIGSHCFDTVQYILGEKIVRVYARLLTVHPKRKRSTQEGKTFEKQNGNEYELVDIASEDAGYIMVEFESGVTGIFTLSQIAAGCKNGLKISVDGSVYSMSWEQENADKLLIGNRESGKTLLYAGAGSMTGAANLYATLPAGHAVAWSDALKNGICAYYDYIQNGGEKKFTDFQDGMEIVGIVEACLESSRKNRWVDVSEVWQKTMEGGICHGER